MSHLSFIQIINWDIYPDMHQIDDMDIRILGQLQRDGTLSVDALSERVNLSRNACWRRVKLMEERGLIKGRVAILDAEAAGCGLSVFIFVRAASHDADWLRQFREAVAAFPEIVGSTAPPAISTMCSAPACPTSRPMTGSTSG
jgi:Lrp/AsnC family transcriptional regulator